MIRVTCPACGKRLKVPVEGAGRTVKCARCKKPVLVPTPETDADDLDLSKVPVLGPLFDSEPESEPEPEPLPPPVVEPLYLPPLPPPVAPPPIPTAVWAAEEAEEAVPPPLPVPAAKSGDAAQGVRYVTEDPAWVTKVLVGGLIISFPILEAVCDGYQIQTIRNVRDGKRKPLPAWDDLGGLFKAGLPLRLAVYAMYLPALALSVLTVFMDIAWLARFFFDSDTQRDMSFAKTLYNWLLVPLLNVFVVLLQSVLFLTVPALARRVADGASFAGLFDPRPTLRLISANITPYVMAKLTVFVLLLVFGIISSVLGGVGWVVIIGPVIGWLVMGIGRFWGRLTWAYHLAHMRAAA